MNKSSSSKASVQGVVNQASNMILGHDKTPFILKGVILIYKAKFSQFKILLKNIKKVLTKKNENYKIKIIKSFNKVL